MPAGSRPCAYVFPEGRHCGAPPLLDGAFCRMHEPSLAADVQEGRRLGGNRRRKEVMLAGAYDFSGLTTPAEIRRVLEIAIFEALSLDNSPAKVRALIAGAHEAASLLKDNEIAEQIKKLEQAVLHQQPDQDRPFDAEPAAPFVGEEDAIP